MRIWVPFICFRPFFLSSLPPWNSTFRLLTRRQEGPCLSAYSDRVPTVRWALLPGMSPERHRDPPPRKGCLLESGKLTSWGKVAFLTELPAFLQGDAGSPEGMSGVNNQMQFCSKVSSLRRNPSPSPYLLISPQQHSKSNHKCVPLGPSDL